MAGQSVGTRKEAADERQVIGMASFCHDASTFTANTNRENRWIWWKKMGVGPGACEATGHGLRGQYENSNDADLP